MNNKFFTLKIAFISILNLYSMDKEIGIKYPIKQEQKEDTLVIRKDMESVYFTHNVPREIHGAMETCLKILILKSIHETNDKEKEYSSLCYALKKTIGFPGKNVKIESQVIAPFIDFCKYFKQTDNPKKNDLVVYFKDPKFSSITHIGFVHTPTTDSNKEKVVVASKLEKAEKIIVHELFHLPLFFGQYACFLTLKNRFRSIMKIDGHQNYLINMLNHDYKMSCYEIYMAARNATIDYYRTIAFLDPFHAMGYITYCEMKKSLLER